MRSGTYDKAKWHFGGDDWPADLSQLQAFVHTGFYLGWLVDRGLVSEEFERDMRRPMLAFSARRLTGPKLFEECDGVLGEEMLSEEGNAFSSVYYAGDRPDVGYLGEFIGLFPAELPSAYHVPDTWENYQRVRSFLDRRFDEWRRAVAANAPVWGPGLPIAAHWGGIHRDDRDARTCLAERVGPLLRPVGFREVKSRLRFEAYDRVTGRRRKFFFWIGCDTSDEFTALGLSAEVAFDAVERVSWRLQGKNEAASRKLQSSGRTASRRIRHGGDWRTRQRDFGDVWSDVAEALRGPGAAFQDSLRTIDDVIAHYDKMLIDRDAPLGEYDLKSHLCCLYHVRDREGLESAQRLWESRVVTHALSRETCLALLRHWDDGWGSEPSQRP